MAGPPSLSSPATSVSEDNGIAALTDNDLKVYSVGISTGGIAEIRMAAMNSRRHIVATTIDEAGMAFAKQQITAAGLARQIETKLEDVSRPLDHADNSFDYVYARLVLYYLPKQGLMKALSELYRVLKPGGKLFVVVRSTKSAAAQYKDNTFDPATQLTTYAEVNEASGRRQLFSRFFHTEDSISHYARQAGFTVQRVTFYDERLFVDFERTIMAPELDNVIELLAVK